MCRNCVLCHNAVKLSVTRSTRVEIRSLWPFSQGAINPVTDSDVMVPRPEIYERVVSAIEQYRGSTVPVPDLSKLLGVKPTTLNARFRREHIEVRTVGRTNYIPYELALRLAELHKY